MNYIEAPQFQQFGEGSIRNRNVMIPEVPVGAAGVTGIGANQNDTTVGSQAALYLVSEDASFITGTVLVVDGGGLAGG